MIRTRRALGHALVELMLEQRFDEIRVEQVLERAQVGRATFYSHFESKRDLLLADTHRMCDFMLDEFAARGPAERRLVPVTELFTHIGNAMQTGFVDALLQSGMRDPVMTIITTRLARGIESRLVLRAASSSLSLPLVARMFAAALVEMLDWWVKAGMVPSAEEMDRRYHEIIGGGIVRLGGER